MESQANNLVITEPEDHDKSQEKSVGSPTSNMLNDSKIASTSSPKRRRDMLRRVMSVPIKDIEGSGLKGEINAPPSDSWAWRKYGQKPIKGSPYPRGYYRCSSSKGCPARKQVERSREDPTMLVITYSSEHNHPCPASRNSHHNHRHRLPQSPNNSTVPNFSTPTTTTTVDTESTATISDAQQDNSASSSRSELVSDQNFVDLAEETFVPINEFGWFVDFGSVSSAMMEDPILVDDRFTEADKALIISASEEDESLFADLGELPECSIVFRRGPVEREEEQRRCNLIPCCGTTM